MSDSNGGMSYIGLVGSIWAILLSWGEHHDVIWALIAGFFSWIYVIYFGLQYEYWVPMIPAVQKAVGG